MNAKLTDEHRYEVRFGGSGGQGIILAAVIFAEAAGIYDGYYVCQTQSYGPESRGGKSKAEVVISEHEIDYPKVLQMDLFLAMNQSALDAYFYDFRPNGLLLTDSTFIEQTPTSRVVAIPFTRIAREKFDNEVVANIIALGAVAKLCPKVSLESLKKAVAGRVPPHTQDMNLQALEAGVQAASAFNLDDLPRSIIPEEEAEV